MEEIYDFGAILQRLRKEKKLTQKDLAQLIHKEDSIISRYENGMQNPTFETVREFASIFNVSMDYLAGMEQQGMISTQGLSESQSNTVRALINAYHIKNAQTVKQITKEQFTVLGEIAAELTK